MYSEARGQVLEIACSVESFITSSGDILVIPFSRNFPVLPFLIFLTHRIHLYLTFL